MTVLGIDPGRGRCGLALCSAGGRILARAVVPPPEVAAVVLRWVAEHPVDAIVVGSGTGSAQVVAALAGLGAADRIPRVTLVQERDTTLAARRRYFADHPLRGWRRFVPRSFQVPPEPYDDYAAVILAEQQLEQSAH
jgi:RNase H-fold protein (predicted Holliday junction resolvase)